MCNNAHHSVLITHQRREALAVEGKGVHLPVQLGPGALRGPVEEGAGQPRQTQRGGEVEQGRGHGGIGDWGHVTTVTMGAGGAEPAAHGHEVVFKLSQVFLRCNNQNLHLCTLAARKSKN